MPQAQSFNSATALKPWMRESRQVSADGPARFKSATALKPLMTMYSRSFICTGWRFNSATALKPWMNRVLLRLATLGIELQFGHGVEAVDDGGFQGGRRSS